MLHILIDQRIVVKTSRMYQNQTSLFYFFSVVVFFFCLWIDSLSRCSKKKLIHLVSFSYILSWIMLGNISYHSSSLLACPPSASLHPLFQRLHMTNNQRKKTIKQANIFTSEISYKPIYVLKSHVYLYGFIWIEFQLNYLFID